jgi:hypothetical protein
MISETEEAGFSKPNGGVGRKLKTTCQIALPG